MLHKMQILLIGLDVVLLSTVTIGYRLETHSSAEEDDFHSHLIEMASDKIYVMDQDQVQPIPTNRWDKEDSAFWKKQAQDTLKQKLQQKQNLNWAKNVIFFLGDGNSLPTITATRIYMAQKQGLMGEENFLSYETFPYAATVKTYNTNFQVPDSAGTATAYLCGVKANMGTIGVDVGVKAGQCELNHEQSQIAQSLMKWSQDAGKSTGFVTTQSVTDASPASLYAHISHRGWQSDHDMHPNNSHCDWKDIAKQLIENEEGRRAKVIMGGGRTKFRRKHAGGKRRDHRNLIQEWLDAKRTITANFHYIENRTELMAIDTNTTEYLFGLFNDGDTTMMARRNQSHWENEPTLSEMTVKAIEILQKDDKGYFLFVEGGAIDMGHHYGVANWALEEGVEFAKTIEMAMGMVDESDTLIVVTADHAHTLTFNGYPGRGNPILGVGFASDVEPYFNYTTLSYGSGPGYRGENISSLQEVFDRNGTYENGYHQLATMPNKMETHGGDDVIVYARGPMSHLFSGVIEQNFIAHAVAYSSCVGPNTDHCSGSVVIAPSLSCFAFVLFSLLVLLNK